MKLKRVKDWVFSVLYVMVTGFFGMIVGIYPALFQIESHVLLVVSISLAAAGLTVGFFQGLILNRNLSTFAVPIGWFVLGVIVSFAVQFAPITAFVVVAPISASLGARRGNLYGDDKRLVHILWAFVVCFLFILVYLTSDTVYDLLPRNMQLWLADVSWLP
ncbi:MAG: hypothetical protein ABFD54_05010 [Armatimonadota bacterium]|nr:hypothetical protein [bacterium]